jgi:hypothetical protein
VLKRTTKVVFQFAHDTTTEASRKQNPKVE